MAVEQAGNPWCQEIEKIPNLDSKGAGTVITFDLYIPSALFERGQELFFFSDMY